MSDKYAEVVRHSLHVLADAHKYAIRSHERHAREGFDALLALEADLDAANAKIEKWVQRCYEADEHLHAANARADEAEAMCEWLASDSPCHTGQMKCWHETDGDYERTDGCNEKSLDACTAYRLTAAREAVRHE